MKIPARGFTLVELLVVLAIMAIVGVFTLANYKSFGEDQKLKSAVLNIQSLLRQAQTNATANVKCDTSTDVLYGATWMVTFDNTTTFRLQCTNDRSNIYSQKTSQPDPNDPNITMQVDPSLNCPDSGQIFSITFAPLSGKIEFRDFMYREMPNCTSIIINLRNRGIPNPRSLKIERGGRIYGQ